MSETAQEDFDYIRAALSDEPEPGSLILPDGRRARSRTIRNAEKGKALAALDALTTRFNAMLAATAEAQHLIDVASRRIALLGKVESAARAYLAAREQVEDIGMVTVKHPSADVEHDQALSNLAASLEAMDRERKPPTPEAL